jgi:N-hydroxyarylamine O-acetyltransferase
MNIDSYLKRIGYNGPLAPTAETLRDLQVAHLIAVPFENLSIHSGEPIVLDDEALFTKIVERRRGGFCYEVNGLFALLLRALGFEVSMLAAGVAKDSGEFGPEFGHMTLMVTLDQRWLADVGFGDSFLEPLLLDERGEQLQRTGSYQITATGPHLVLNHRKNDEDWRPQYRFTLEPHVYADYEETCLYHQTSPDSHFTKKRICSRATHDGRITLSDMRLITTSGAGQRDERLLETQEEYDRILRQHFGIARLSFKSPSS